MFRSVGLGVGNSPPPPPFLSLFLLSTNFRHSRRRRRRIVPAGQTSSSLSTARCCHSSAATAAAAFHPAHSGLRTFSSTKRRLPQPRLHVASTDARLFTDQEDAAAAGYGRRQRRTSATGGKWQGGDRRTSGAGIVTSVPATASNRHRAPSLILDVVVIRSSNSTGS